MTEAKNDSISARKLMSLERTLDPVCVDKVDPEIRSGISVPFRDALKRGVSAEAHDQIEQSIQGGALLDRFVSEWGFDVEYAKSEKFHAWLLVNEKNLACACPEGVRYLGTYYVSLGDRRDTGHYRTIWAFETFGAMQDLSQAIGDPSSLLAQLLQQFHAFRDRDRSATEIEWMMVPAASTHRF